MEELSLPTRERGLKFRYAHTIQQISKVAPYTGAWIEIDKGRLCAAAPTVAPYTGAWIEIFACLTDTENISVAPYTGAWIEISRN